jgi:glycosyltransferase involved in cell wall biosynthesis
VTPPELLSIIVPVYNEVRTVLAVIDRLLAIDLPLAREIIVVNDGSTDGTRAVLDSIESRIPLARRSSESGGGNPESRVTVIHAERNAGKGAAIRLGLEAATGTIVAIQDADLELDPQQLSALVAPIVRGEAEVVYGSRFLAGRPAAPWITIAANGVLTATTNLLFGSSITDMETCYKIMRADVAHSLQLDANRFDIEPQITARLLRGGHRIHELPIKFEPRSRAQGKKIGWRDGVRAIEVLVKERFRSANPKSQIPSSKLQ